MNSSEIEQLLLPNENALSFITRKNRRPLYTGINPFDQSTLNGQGIVPGDIVEIYGNQSCGSSQICMTICLNCIMPRIDPQDNLQENQTESNSDVLFFDKDFRFDEIQLVLMLEERIYTTLMSHICENKKMQGIKPYNQVDQMEYDQYFATIFPTDESFSTFISNCIARVKVVRPPDAFSFWMTVESLIHNEKDKVQENNAYKMASSNYGCIIVDSLTGVFYCQHSFQHKNWERACDALTRLARQKDISVFATVRETFSKESRKKYKNELFATNEYNRQFYSEEQRKMEEMFILHREMMPSPWKDRINYRLIIEEDERATHGGYLAILCAMTSESDFLAYKKNERRAIKPKRLYKYSINNCGVIWE